MLVILLITLFFHTALGQGCECHFPQNGIVDVTEPGSPKAQFTYAFQVGQPTVTLRPTNGAQFTFRRKELNVDTGDIKECTRCGCSDASGEAIFPTCLPSGNIRAQASNGIQEYWVFDSNGIWVYKLDTAFRCKPVEVSLTSGRTWEFS